MTTLTTPATDQTAGPAVPTIAGPRDTGFILLMSHLVWIGWIWVPALVLLPVALVLIGAGGGDLTESLWAGAGLGWQRWILFAAGVTVSTTYLREFVSRGVTRRRLAHGALVAMAGLVVLLAAVAIVGFLEEWAVFHWQDWPQQVQSDGEFGAGRIPRLALEHALLGAAYHLAGCLVGAAWKRYRWPNAIVCIPLCLVPAALVELTVSRSAGNFEIGALPEAIRDPAIVTTVLVGAAVIAATAVVVTRVIRTLELR